MVHSASAGGHVLPLLPAYAPPPAPALPPPTTADTIAILIAGVVQAQTGAGRPATSAEVLAALAPWQLGRLPLPRLTARGMTLLLRRYDGCEANGRVLRSAGTVANRALHKVVHARSGDMLARSFP
jgi:hypothetical protein